MAKKTALNFQFDRFRSLFEAAFFPLFSFALRCPTRSLASPPRTLPDNLQRAAEQPIEIRCQRLVFRNRLLDCLLGRLPLVAQIGQR